VVIEIAPGIDVDGVAVGEVADAVGKLSRVRHVGLADQQRNDRNAPGERRFDFDPHIVGLGADAWFTVALATNQRGPTNDHQHIAFLDA